MNLTEITPLVLTKDEEVNIGRTLGQLAWATEVIVVDSMSTDRTGEIASSFPNVRLLRRELDSLAGQTSFGLAAVRSPWVLLLDADYFVTADLVEEFGALEPHAGICGFRAAFTYAVNGKPLRASLYPPRVVLLKKDHSTIWQDGHTPRILIDGETTTLQGKVIHDDRKSFERFIARQKRYMAQEADKLLTVDPRTLSAAGRIRKLIVVAPFAALFHALFIRGVILDGPPGLRYAAERFTAELMLSAELLRRLLRR